MAQNALELYKYIKGDPSLKLDLKPNYLQQPAQQEQEYYSAPGQEDYYQPVELYGQGGSTNNGQMFRGGVQASMPYGKGNISGGVGGFYMKDAPYSNSYITDANLSYNTSPYSVGAEYSNNPMEYAPLNYEPEAPTNYLGQNVLGRAKFRY